MSEYLFNYEDFCTDISKYLVEHKHEFTVYSFDGLSSYIDQDLLAKKLSDFWLNLTE